MDELHRRIALEVCLLATTATLFLFAALHPLDKAGVFQGLGLHAGLDLHTWWGTSWLMVCFYILGGKIMENISGEAVPLLFQPGARWEYSVAVDVQGRLIEVLTGKKLGEALSERVLQPLGMVDTSFQVPAAKLARAAQPGQKPNGPPMTPRFKVDDGAQRESGGGGLLSTTDDYLRFTMALANGGAFGGKRIIGRKTLEFMTADHVGNRPGRPDGFGFGLGFDVHTRLGDSAIEGSVGEYGWSGAAGTTFWVDPKEQLVAIYMVQASEGDTRFLRSQFRTMVQAALID
jgi:CubicO group peptidase (beta-lactamase class C family)